MQLFNIMTCKEEARRLQGSGVEVLVAHPGLSTTDHFGKARAPQVCPRLTDIDI